MKILNLKKSISIILMIMTGTLFLITINGCTITEVILKPGSDTDPSWQDFPPDERTGPCPLAPAHGDSEQQGFSVSLQFCFAGLF